MLISRQIYAPHRLWSSYFLIRFPLLSRLMNMRISFSVWITSECHYLSYFSSPIDEFPSSSDFRPLKIPFTSVRLNQCAIKNEKNFIRWRWDFIFLCQPGVMYVAHQTMKGSISIPSPFTKCDRNHEAHKNGKQKISSAPFFRLSAAIK